MSSGASVAYEKPRSGRSICIDEMPRSSRIASAFTSFAASWVSTSAKSPRRNRTSTPARARKRSKNDFAEGSRSIATSFPRPARSSASRRACPPAPNVASTTVSPGRTASSSRTRSARTGTWSASVCGKTFGSMLDAPFDGVQVLLPRGWVPELEVVVVARDDDVALQSGVPDERRGHEHAAGAVDVGLARAGEEEPAELARLTRKRVEHRHAGLDGHLPRLPGVDGDVAVDPTREHDALAERLAEARRQREPALVVNRVLEGADEHRRGPWPIVVVTRTYVRERLRVPGQRTATCRGATPLPVSAPAPQRAANAIASSSESPDPSA